MRDEWNSASVRALAIDTARVLFLAPAHDFVKKPYRRVNAREAAAIASLAPKDRGGGFLDSVELVVGMECMIVQNVSGRVQYGVANGSRGIISGICLHPNDQHLISINSVGPSSLLSSIISKC